MSDRPVIDPKAWLRLPDSELGYLLLAQFVEAQASKIGLPIEKLSIEFMERVRQHVLTLSADSAKLASVQLALHAVASGDPGRAGRLYRQLLLDGAENMTFRNFTAREMNLRKSRARKGGRRSVESRRQNSKAQDIERIARRLKRNRVPRKDWRGIIARETNSTPQYVGRVLNKIEI